MDVSKTWLTRRMLLFFVLFSHWKWWGKPVLDESSNWQYNFALKWSSLTPAINRLSATHGGQPITVRTRVVAPNANSRGGDRGVSQNQFWLLFSHSKRRETRANEENLVPDKKQETTLEVRGVKVCNKDKCLFRTHSRLGSLSVACP